MRERVSEKRELFYLSVRSFIDTRTENMWGKNVHAEHVCANNRYNNLPLFKSKSFSLTWEGDQARGTCTRLVTIKLNHWQIKNKRKERKA